MRETNGSAWMANRRRGCGDDLRRFDTQPGEQVSDRGDRETADGQRWNSLEMTGSALPDASDLEIAVNQTVIAIATVTVGKVNDEVDTRVYVGVFR